MKTIVLNEPGDLMEKDAPDPAKLGANEVLLKVRCLGICGTDLHAYKGRQPFFTYPRILGHEVAAEIVSFGQHVTHLKKGDMCTVLPYRNLIADQAVKSGKVNCGSGLHYMGVHEDGAMQEYFIRNADEIILCKDLDAEQIAMIEPLSIASHAIERACIKPSDIVLVAGAGPIGILTIAMGQLKGARFIATDLNQQRLAFVKEKYPATGIIVTNDHLLSNIRELLEGDLPTIIIDATGNRESMMNCFEYIAPGGTIVFVGLFTGNIEFSDPKFHAKEITLKSSRAAVPEDFRKVIRLLPGRTIHIDGLITHRLPFDSLTDTFPQLYNPDKQVIKAVIEF